MREKKKGLTSVVYLTVVRRVSRPEVVRRWGTADMVASWFLEDEGEHVRLMES